MAKFIDFLSSGAGLIFTGVAIVVVVGGSFYITTTLKSDSDKENESTNYSPDVFNLTNGTTGGTKRRRKHHTKSRRRR